MQPDTTKSNHQKKKATPSVKDDYVKKMQAQGKEWEASMALWGAKADKASAEVKGEFHKWQRDFQDRQGDAQKKLEALNASNHEAWEEVKTGVESAWNDVKDAFESAKKKYS